MQCEGCQEPAKYICRCTGARLCAECVDLHSAVETVEHQLVGIEEGEESYTTAEMLARPEIVTKRLEQELVRLEGFRRSVLKLAHCALEDYKRHLLSKAQDRLESYKPELNQQKEQLQAALNRLRTEDILTPLPKQGFPWDISSADTAIRLPKDLAGLEFHLEEVLEVNAEWDLMGYAAEREEKQRNSLVLHPPAHISPENSEENTPFEVIFDYSDPVSVFKALKKDQIRRLNYLEEQKSQEKFQKLLESAEFDKLWKLKVTNWASNDPWTSLSLLILSLPHLNHLQIRQSSIPLVFFQQLTEAIQQSALLKLSFKRCKLGNTHVKALIAALPPPLQELNLSGNYFNVGIVRSVPFLRKLTVREMPIPEKWVESVECSDPQLVVVTSPNSS